MTSKHKNQNPALQKERILGTFNRKIHESLSFKRDLMTHILQLWTSALRLKGKYGSALMPTHDHIVQLRPSLKVNP